MKKSYENLVGIRKHDLHDKAILIIGAGFMAEQYCIALKTMGIGKVVVISKTRASADRIHEKYNFRTLFGGYETTLKSIGTFDLVLVAAPILDLIPAASLAIEYGNRNILVEKPGAMHSSDLDSWNRDLMGCDLRVRIACNRHTYPSFWKVKELCEEEGGIMSCTYTFTEWLHSIGIQNYPPEVAKRWGIANSLHVIGMAHELIGLPDRIATYQSGTLPWHVNGSRFVGAGISQKGIPFSYHADWDSTGRWGISLMTHHHEYRLIPLEKIYRCKKGSVEFEPVEFQTAFPHVKCGVAEEVTLMLNKELEKVIPLVSVEKMGHIVRLTENIMGY